MGSLVQVFCRKLCMSPGSHCLNYHPGTLRFCSVIGHFNMKPNGYQGDMPISHNASHWNRNVHISVPMWFIVGYGTGALWDLSDWLIDWYHHSTPTCSAVTIIVTTWLPGWRVNHLTYKKKVLKQIFMTNMQNIYIKNKLRCILYGAIDLLKQIFMINVQNIYKTRASMEEANTPEA